MGYPISLLENRCPLNVYLILCFGSYSKETFEKCSVLSKVKKGENFNHRHTLSISRIKI
jgi:hypothetical protein